MLQIKQGGEGAFNVILEGLKGARSHSKWVLTHFQWHRSRECRTVHHRAPTGPLYFPPVPQFGKLPAQTEFLEVQRPANNGRHWTHWRKVDPENEIWLIWLTKPQQQIEWIIIIGHWDQIHTQRDCSFVFPFLTWILLSLVRLRTMVE